MQDTEINNAISIEGAKSSSLGLLLLCAFFSSSPLAPLIAASASISYLASVSIDKMLTGRMCLVPLCRVGVGDALALVGAFQGGQVDESVAGLLEGSGDWSEGYRSRKGLEATPLVLPPTEPFKAMETRRSSTRKIEASPEDVITIPRTSKVVKTFPSREAPSQPQAKTAEPDPWEEDYEAMELGKQLKEAGLAVKVEPREKPATAKTALQRLLDNPFESRAFFGAQRTGKTYLATVAAKKSGANIYHINLASFGTEDASYSEGFKSSITGDIEMLDHDDALDLIGKAMGAVETFFSDPEPSILIMDEWAIVGSTMNRHASTLESFMKILASRASALSSAGKKRRKAIWAISPKLVAGELTQAGKAIKGLKLCYVTISPNRSVLWEGQKIQFSNELYEQLQRNYSFPHPGEFWKENRICYIDNSWVSVGDLLNA